MITAAMLIESEFWADDTERELYFAMQKQLMDEASAERSISIYAHQKGLEEGLEKGLQKGKKEGIMEGLQKGEHIKAIQTARKMLARKMDVSLIADVTGGQPREATELSLPFSRPASQPSPHRLPRRHSSRTRYVSSGPTKSLGFGDPNR